MAAASGKVLRILISLSKAPSPGPAPVFSYTHICLALLTIGDGGPIGRIELSRRLGLGEGTIRTIIKHLADADLVATVKEGCVLTKRGTTIYKSLRAKLSQVSIVDAKQLALDKVSAAILIRGASRLVKRGIEQRDEAIRAGARGACTLVVRKGKYVMPMAENGDWTFGPEDPLVEELERVFHPKENDVVTITSASSRLLAEHAVIAAAITLLE